MSSPTASSRAQSPDSDSVTTPVRLSDTDTTPSPSKWTSPPVSPGLLTSKLALLEAANALSAAADTLAAASQAMSSAAKSLATASGSLAQGSMQHHHAQYRTMHQEYSPLEHSRSPSPLEFDWQAPSYTLRATDNRQDNQCNGTTNTASTHNNTSTRADASAYSTASTPDGPFQPPTLEGVKPSIPDPYPDLQIAPVTPSEMQPTEGPSLNAFAQPIDNDHGWGAPSDKPTRSRGPPGMQGSVTGVPSWNLPANLPAPVSESATPIEPPRGPQIQPTTTFNAQFNSNPSAYPITTPREYIVLNSEFDVIPLICHLTNKVTSGSILCFVESINTLEPLGSLIGPLVSRPVHIDIIQRKLSTGSSRSLQSPGGCLIFRSAYHDLPSNVSGGSISMVIHVGWRGDEAMYLRHAARVGAKPSIVILNEREAPKGAKVFDALNKHGIQAGSAVETNLFNNQTIYALLAQLREQWRVQLRSEGASKHCRVAYMAWITHFSSKQHQLPNWSATNVIAQANRFAREVLLRGRTGNVVGGLPSVTAGFVKTLKLRQAVSNGSLLVQG